MNLVKGIKLSDYITENNITLTEQEIDALLVKALGIATDICSEEKRLSEVISEVGTEDVLTRVFNEGYRKGVKHAMSKRSDIK